MNARADWNAPWWLERGGERCGFCYLHYPTETEYRCADCDAAICPECVVAVRATGIVYCPECAPRGAARQRAVPRRSNAGRPSRLSGRRR